MSLASLQFNNSEIRKSRYESLSKVSLEEFTLHEEEHIGFLHEYCDKYLGYEFEIKKKIDQQRGLSPQIGIGLHDIEKPGVYSLWQRCATANLTIVVTAFRYRLLRKARAVLLMQLDV